MAKRGVGAGTIIGSIAALGVIGIVGYYAYKKISQAQPQQQQDMGLGGGAIGGAGPGGYPLPGGQPFTPPSFNIYWTLQGPGPGGPGTGAPTGVQGILPGGTIYQGIPGTNIYALAPQTSGISPSSPYQAWTTAFTANAPPVGTTPPPPGYVQPPPSVVVYGSPVSPVYSPLTQTAPTSGGGAGRRLLT